MGTVYTAVFPKSSLVLASDRASSSLPSRASPPISYIDDLGERHVRYANAPEILHEDATPVSSEFYDRSNGVKNTVEGLFAQANGDPTRPEWGHITHATRLRCISNRRYMVQHTQFDSTDIHTAAIGPLVETDEEWLAWEVQQKETAQVRQRMESTTRKSQLFARTEMAGSSKPTYKEKIARWQATLRPPSQLEGGSHMEKASTRPASDRKGKQRELQDDAVITIHDVPANSLPVPSFPTQDIIRSTPRKARIAPSGLSSPPRTPTGLDIDRDGHDEETNPFNQLPPEHHVAARSSQPRSSPETLKRLQPITPPDEGAEGLRLSTFRALKRARTAPEASEGELPSLGALRRANTVPHESERTPRRHPSVPLAPTSTHKPSNTYIPTLTELLTKSPMRPRIRVHSFVPQPALVPQETDPVLLAPPIATLTSSIPTSSQEVDELVTNSSIPRFSQNPGAFAPLDASIAGQGNRTPKLGDLISSPRLREQMEEVCDPYTTKALSAPEGSLPLPSSPFPNFTQNPEAFQPVDASIMATLFPDLACDEGRSRPNPLSLPPSSQIPAFSQDPAAFAPADASGFGTREVKFASFAYSSQAMKAELEAGARNAAEVLEKDLDDLSAWLRDPDEAEALYAGPR